MKKTVPSDDNKVERHEQVHALQRTYGSRSTNRENITLAACSHSRSRDGCLSLWAVLYSLGKLYFNFRFKVHLGLNTEHSQKIWTQKMGVDGWGTKIEPTLGLLTNAL